jgi:hypothetical protein
MKQVKDDVDHIKLAAAMSGAEIPSHNGVDCENLTKARFSFCD